MKKKTAPAGDEPPAKRAKFLSDDEDSDVEGNNGVLLNVNEDYAKRFEYNKKREEKQRLEEKYKDNLSDSEDESTSEEEDDAADLATENLDAEIFATLDAIKKKDPRVYDKNVTFYTPFEVDAADENAPKKEKPMYLADYQKKMLLEGQAKDGEEEDDAPPRTYAQEQQDLKNSLVNQMHGAVADQEESDDEEGGFLIKKDKGIHADMPAAKTTRPKITSTDIDSADRDPETFLSNFMASRAWVPDTTSRFQAFDSDDSEDEARAEQFEHAYNLRFEDPKASNEKLMTFSRDVAKQSVRRDDLSGRKKQREKEREKKDAEKKQRDEEKARLRRFKIEEVEEKVKKIKEAAGLRGEALDLNEWGKVLEEDWDDDRWEEEMQKRFGDGYYAEKDARLEEDEEAKVDTSSKKVKKPKWDDDIDIKDLVPDFKDEEEAEKPAFTLSDDEEDEAAEAPEGDEDGMDIDADAEGSGKRKTKKDRLKEQADKKRIARKERMAIEELVDNDLAASLPANSKSVGFRYRETSPDAFGLTPRDILFADDSALNQFAGLKKMAAFRDEDKKRKDKKKLGKKARLRQWRKDTFGNEDGFAGGFKEFLTDEAAGEGQQASEGGSRKRRGKKRKVDSVEA